MKNICFILPALLPFPPTLGGAVETLLNLFIDENEVMKKYNITVFSIYDETAKEESQKYKNTKVIYIKTDDSRSSSLRTLSDVIQKKLHVNILDAYNQKVLNYIKKGVKADLYIVEGGRYRDYKSISRYVGLKKLAIHIHAVSTPKFNANRLFGSFIFVSESAKNVWCKKNNYNGYILKNSVDENRFYQDSSDVQCSSIKKRLGLYKDDFTVLYCGRLIEQKGVLELIKAINRIDDRRIKLLLVGSSNFANAQITDYQKELHKYISEKIVFTGYIDNKDLYQYYQIADIVATPSICEESACLVNIEAMLSGKAIITTDKGGIPEYVDDKGAIMINYDGNKERLVGLLAESIKYLYNNRDKIVEMEKHNSMLSRNFTKHKYYEKFSMIIESIISNEADE